MLRLCDFSVTDGLCVHRVSKIWGLVLWVDIIGKVVRGSVYSPTWRNVYNCYPFEYSYNEKLGKYSLL